MVGTCFCSELRHLDLNAVQSWSIGELMLWFAVNSVENSARSFFMPLRSACFNRWMSRRAGFCLDGTTLESNKMASWSLSRDVNTLIHYCGVVCDDDI